MLKNNEKEPADIFMELDDRSSPPVTDLEDCCRECCFCSDEPDTDPYDLMYYLFREIAQLEHKVVRLRQEVNRMSPEKNLYRKPYQDAYGDLSCYYNDHPGYKKYVELYREEPYDGEWGTDPDLGDSSLEHRLGKKGTY